jgi:hypothetical protein
MATFFVGLNAVSNYKVAPCYPTGERNPPQAFVANMIFNNAQPNGVVDLSSDDRALEFSLVCLFVDNSSANSVAMTITVQGTGQKIVVKANTQGYYPVVSADREGGAANIVLQIAAPNAGAQSALVQFILLNYMVEPFVWPTV